MWRSDALKALAAIREVKDARDARAEECTRDLMSLINNLLSKSIDLEMLEMKLLENVIKPAFELSQIMCTSTHRYAIRYPKKVSGSVFKNLDGWTTVKKLDQIERVVRRLHPALLLLDKGEHFPIVLVKPVVVASLRESRS
jgi:L-rhamnose isomerase